LSYFIWDFPAYSDLLRGQIGFGFFIASAKSKGALLVSATDPIKNIINIGNRGIMNHIAL
jgi:hypothetical protein